MKTHKFESTDAFLVFDFPDAEVSSGLVRCAPKILQSTAQELARSATYMMAAHGVKRGGASVGINAKPEERPDAIAKFVSEVEELVASGRFLPDHGRGVLEDDIHSLRVHDHRGELLFSEYEGMTFATYLRAASAVAAVCAALDAEGGLDSKTVAIEGFSHPGLAAAKELSEQGAKVIAISTEAGVARRQEGFAYEDLQGAFKEHGPEVVKHLASTAESNTDSSTEASSSADGGTIWETEANIFFAGSKLGAVDHTVAEKFAPKVLASLISLAFTTKALVWLQRKGTIVLPDFVCLGGALYGEQDKAAPADLEAQSYDTAIAKAKEGTANLTKEAASHPEGHFLGACALAENFLQSWRETLPFGRPLAP